VNDDFRVLFTELSGNQSSFDKLRPSTKYCDDFQFFTFV
jgi:hypothetical protein